MARLRSINHITDEVWLNDDPRDEWLENFHHRYRCLACEQERIEPPGPELTGDARQCCGQDMEHVGITSRTNRSITGLFSQPIEMYSIASDNPAHINEMRQAGIEVRDGVPVAHSRQEKLKALKIAGFSEKS